MASWNVKQFYKVIQSGKTDGYFSFIGEDAYLLDGALKTLKPLVLGEGLEDFNYNMYYGNEVDVAELKEVVETLPMMGPKRLIIVKDAQMLKAKQLEALVDVLSVYIDSTVLVLVFAKVDKRKKVFKDIFKYSTVVDFKSPSDREIPMWINQLCKNHGKKMSPNVVQMFQNYVGINLIDLDNEIRKLALYIGEREDIELEDLEAVVCKTKIESVFNLTESLGKGQLNVSLEQLKHLLDQGESELGVLAMITRHVRLLVFAKEGIENGLGKSQLASHIGVPPFFLHQYTGQAQKWSHEKLHSTYKLLQKTDSSLKSVSVAPKFYMENLVEKTCGL